jgi:hypothetical protein
MQQLRGDGLLGSALRTVSTPDIAALRRTGEFDPNYLHGDGPVNWPAFSNDR